MEDMEDPAFLEDMGSTENLDTSADIEDAGETYGGGVVSCGEIREGLQVSSSEVNKNHSHQVS